MKGRKETEETGENVPEISPCYGLAVIYVVLAGCVDVCCVELQIVRSWSVNRCATRRVCTQLTSLCSVSSAHTRLSTPRRLSTHGPHFLDATNPSLPDSETDIASPTSSLESVLLILSLSSRINNR